MRQHKGGRESDFLSVRLYFAVERDTARGEMAAQKGSCAVGGRHRGCTCSMGSLGSRWAANMSNESPPDGCEGHDCKGTHAVDATKAGEEVDNEGGDDDRGGWCAP